LIDAEYFSEDKLEVLHRFHAELVVLATKNRHLSESY